ncbi:MAG TPA: ATP-binding protein [Clostridia bacterium]|jgi:hypothetical protein|nr:ATP-binding protein [Clostridia bacterium]
MQVVGITDQQEVWVASKEVKLQINQILIIEDEDLDNPRGEVVCTQSYNRYIPLSIGQSFVDQTVLESLRQIGYNLEQDEINLAKVRLLTEATYPIKPGCSVRIPTFEEVKDLLIKSPNLDEAMVLGVIRGTEDLTSSLEPEYQGIAPLLNNGEFVSQKGVPFVFDPRAMQQYPHIGIFGGSGSGKSFGLRVFLEEIMKLGLPALMFDPHFEMDFSDPFPGIPEDYRKDFRDRFAIFQVGQEVGVQFEKLGVKELTDLLAASGGGLSESMVNAVETVHERRDSFLSFRNRLEGIREALQMGKSKIERVLKEEALNRQKEEELQQYLEYCNKYGSLPVSTVGGIIWRLDRLNRSGLFNRNIDPVINGLQSGKLVVIQGPIWLLGVFATYVLGHVYRKRREYRDAQLRREAAEYFPPFLIVTDEAHNFAPKGYDSPAKSIIREIAQEGRKYGAFLILATQRPTLLDETVTAQLNTKFVFRTVRGTDIATIKEETDLRPEESRRLPYLRSGDAFVSSAIFGRTLSVRIRAAKTTSPHTDNPFDELKSKRRQKEDEFFELIKDKLPIMEAQALEILKDLQTSGFEFSLDSVEQLLEQLNQLVRQGKLVKENSPFGAVYR